MKQTLWEKIKNRFSDVFYQYQESDTAHCDAYGHMMADEMLSLIKQTLESVVPEEKEVINYDIMDYEDHWHDGVVTGHNRAIQQIKQNIEKVVG